MNSDIRVSTTFFFHRKTKKLRQALKDHGVLCLLKLWTRVAIEKPCGVLSGWDVQDIELEADFEGEPGKFVSELLRLGFLNEKDGVYILHNWDERQGWVSRSEERGNKARFSRMSKTHKDIYEKMVSDGYKSITRKEYQKLTAEKRTLNESSTNRQQPVEEATTPSPSPSPSSKKKNIDKKKASQIPSDFQITASMRTWFAHQNFSFNIQNETDKFIDHAIGKGRLQKDWIAAWRLWMRKAQEYIKTDPKENGPTFEEEYQNQLKKGGPK